MAGEASNIDPELEFCLDRIKHFEAKADHNKAEALRLLFYSFSAHWLRLCSLHLDRG